MLSLVGLKRLMANRNFARLRVLWRVEELRQTGKAALTAALARRATCMTFTPREVAGGFDTGEDDFEDDSGGEGAEGGAT